MPYRYIPGYSAYLSRMIESLIFPQLSVYSNLLSVDYQHEVLAVGVMWPLEYKSFMIILYLLNIPQSSVK